MKKTIFGILVLLILVFLTTSLWSAAPARADDWEVRWNQRQPPVKVMNAIGVKRGMTVGEFGAGTGRYAVQVADFIGNNGLFYANDIDPDALQYLEKRCQKDGIKNIKIILGEVTHPKFPPKKLDVIFCINTYHHVAKPVALLKNVVPALKPNGLLAIIEHEPTKAKNMGHHGTPKDTVLAQAKEAGFELIRIETFLELDNIYIFKAGK